MRDLMRDQALELGEALVAPHEIVHEAAAHVLPQELGGCLEADVHEHAAEHVIGGLPSCLREVSLHACEQVSLARAGGTVDEERVRLAARGGVDAGQARPECVAVDLGDVGRRLPRILDDVVAEGVRERRELVHVGLLGAMPM
jgi:hypothetical protein